MIPICRRKSGTWKGVGLGGGHQKCLERGRCRSSIRCPPGQRVLIQQSKSNPFTGCSKPPATGKGLGPALSHPCTCSDPEGPGARGGQGSGARRMEEQAISSPGTRPPQQLCKELPPFPPGPSSFSLSSVPRATYTHVPQRPRPRCPAPTWGLPPKCPPDLRLSMSRLNSPPSPFSSHPRAAHPLRPSHPPAGSAQPAFSLPRWVSRSLRTQPARDLFCVAYSTHGHTGIFSQIILTAFLQRRISLSLELHNLSFVKYLLDALKKYSFIEL